VHDSDILLTGIRPQSRKAIGIDFDTVSAVNDRLVYVSLTGFGETGSGLNKPGLDTVAQARSGLFDLIGIELGKPVRIQAMLADMIAGTLAAIGALAGIADRQRTGKGQYVRTSLLEASVSLGALNLHHAHSRVNADGSTPRMRTAGFLLEAADGLPFALHVPPQPERFWYSLVAALDAPELLRDARFATKEDRDRNYEQLHAIVSGLAQKHGRAGWQEIMDAHNIPCGPINLVKDVLDDPLVNEVGLVTTFDDPWGKPLRGVRPGVTFPDRTEVVTRRPPLLGEDTREVLTGLGFSEAEFDEFESAGAFGAASVDGADG
jgi:formyl-CoA transferase